MSDKTWKEEFMPVDPRNVKKEDAVLHGLLKYAGFRKDALLRHGVEARDLPLGQRNCALCLNYICVTGECTGCPLYEVRGKVHCSHSIEGDVRGPYSTSGLRGGMSPEPLIEALMNAYKWEQRQPKKVVGEMKKPMAPPPFHERIFERHNTVKLSRDTYGSKTKIYVNGFCLANLVGGMHSTGNDQACDQVDAEYICRVLNEAIERDLNAIKP